MTLYDEIYKKLIMLDIQYHSVALKNDIFKRKLYLINKDHRSTIIFPFTML
jgi:hypothetical protein